MSIGERLKAWRTRAGLSQEKAAKQVGTVQKAWSAWEKEDRIPEVDFCEEIQRLTKGEISVRDWAKSRRKKRRDGAAAAATRAA